MELYTSFSQFVEDLIARLTGPLNFRLILQPAVAVALGIRDGLKDAREERPPFVMDLILKPENRQRDIKGALKSLSKAIPIAIILDAVAQYLMFKTVYPVAAIFVGTVIMALPYSVARGLTNRIASARMRAAK